MTEAFGSFVWTVVPFGVPCNIYITIYPCVYNFVTKNCFPGKTCDVDVNECMSDPCQNNATCVDDVNGYICECLNGFKGRRKHKLLTISYHCTKNISPISYHLIWTFRVLISCVASILCKRSRHDPDRQNRDRDGDPDPDLL